MTSTAIAPRNISLRGDSELDRYVREISKYPLLSREQEEGLARRFHETGDVEAAHQLVVSNLRFVVKVAHGYKGYGFKLLDLVQEGNIGLMHAVKKFDPNKGYRLISYAVWWIRAQIQNYIMRSWSLVKLGSGRVRRKLFFKLRSEKSKLEREAGAYGDSSREALAKRLGVDLEDVNEMDVRMGFRDFSLDAPVGDESGMTHLEALDGTSDDDGFTEQESALMAKDESAYVGELLDATRDELNEKEQHILRHRLLADEPETLAEIGKTLGVSRERVRQLEARTLKKLRAAAEASGRHSFAG